MSKRHVDDDTNPLALFIPIRSHPFYRDHHHHNQNYYYYFSSHNRQKQWFLWTTTESRKLLLQVRERERVTVVNWKMMKTLTSSCCANRILEKHNDVGFSSFKDLSLSRPQLCLFPSKDVVRIRFLHLLSLQHKRLHPLLSSQDSQVSTLQIFMVLIFFLLLLVLEWFWFWILETVILAFCCWGNSLAWFPSFCYFFNIYDLPCEFLIQSGSDFLLIF